MNRRKLPVDIVAAMRLPRDPDKTLRLDLAVLAWTVDGLADLGTPDPVILDLLEVARVVYEFDRRQPKRTTGVRPRQVRVSIPLRVPERWTEAARAELRALLRIQGNADWQFEFGRRRSVTSQLDTVLTAPSAGSGRRRPAGQSVVLFSGGLDSTCGLATLARRADEFILASYYAGGFEKQRAIAARMGFDRLVQVRSDWRDAESARAGGQFMYRSFLFLALAAVVANATRAGSLLQFENGPLALAVAPLELYRITRHAHPLVHAHFAKLFTLLTGRALAVSNPFLNLTKGEAVTHLRSRLSGDDFKGVLVLTDTCWYLNSKTVVAGRARKENKEPCGACVPCLIRRAALGTDDTKAAADFTKLNGRLERNPVVRVHYDAYSAFARQLLDKSYSPYDFLEQVPEATRLVFTRSQEITLKDAFALYRRFAREWMRTFS